MEEKEIRATVTSDYNNTRVDYTISKIAGISRETVKKFEDNIILNNRKVKPSHRVKEGDIIEFRYKEIIETKNIKPQDISIETVYEDDYIMVVNKPYGMVTHPAKGHWENTLLNAVFSKLKDKDSERPGIVHRLDKDTSGLIVIAKTKKAQEELSREFKKRRIKKIYYALVEGHLLKMKDTIILPIGRDHRNKLKFAVNENGKKAITIYKVLREYKDTSLVAIKIKTGRTHQIRVHLSHIGNPVVGDKIYGKKMKHLDMCLVAKKIGFTHPITKKYLEFSVKIPQHMKDIIKKMIS